MKGSKMRSGIGIRAAALIVAALAVAGMVLPSGIAVADEEVAFADANLAWCVRQALGLGPADPIMRSVVEGVEELGADYQGGSPPGPPARITGLGGIEALVNLRVLRLRDNRVTSIGPLAGLTGLMALDLRENRNVSDLAPLSGLTALEELDLRRNAVSGLAPLAGLTGLTSLNLRRNSLTDIGPLAALQGLVDLNLGENAGITDYSVLQEFPLLEVLGLCDNEITDLEGITSPAAHPWLADLDLSDNQVTDISILAGFRHLTERLLLEDDPVEGFWPVASYYERIEEVDFTLDPPVISFSHPGGFYREGFELELTCSQPGLPVYYTLDGSEPDRGLVSPGGPTFLYAGPVHVDSRGDDPNFFSEIRGTSPEWAAPVGEVFKGTVVRARAYCGAHAPAEPLYPCASGTNTYFVDEDMPERYTLPVISISTGAENLFDYEDGIYVMGKIYDEQYDPDLIWWRRPANYNQEGTEWERPGHLEFFEADGTPGFSQGVGLRINGATTRSLRQKSLRIYAASDYDAEQSIEYEVFPGLETAGGEPLQSFKRLILRNSGADWYSTMFRDALTQSLVEGMRFDTQAYRPAVVFINGEYWGIHNIRERYDDWYLQYTYGVDRDEIVMLESNAVLKEGRPGDQQDYREMLAFIKDNDITDSAVYEQVKTLMDVDSFIDYYIAEIYFDNQDWPGNNVIFWRLRTDGYDPGAPYGHDGRWRWMMNDTDAGFYDYRRDGLGRVAGTGEGHPAPEYTFLFRSLLENGEFRQQLIDGFLYHLESTFAPERVLAAIEEMSAVLEPEIQDHLLRWKTMGCSVDRWASHVEGLREFARRRPAYMTAFLNRRFGLDLPNETYTIKALTGQGGSIGPAGDVEVALLGSADFAITPDPGYDLADVLVDGISVGAVGSYSFADVEADHVIEAVFAPNAEHWYLAEGCTEGGMETWVLVQNPNPGEVTVDLTFMTADGSVDGPRDVILPAASRASFNANDYVTAWDVSTEVASTGGSVVCERAVYGEGRQWATDSVGVTAAADHWYLAEGCTEGGMETWVLVQNPNPGEVTVDLTFMTAQGPVAGPRGVAVPANSRLSLDLGDYITAWDVSTEVASTGGSVVCERAVYGEGRQWATDSAGYSP